MTTNYDRATTAIGDWIDDNLPYDELLFGADEGIAEVLADDNLITADVVVLDKDDRDFVIDTLNSNIHNAQFYSQTGMFDAWKAAADAFIAHTTTNTDNNTSEH